MCGIVGFTGNRQAAPILLDGLSKLEYRGYDSAGLAVRDGENLAQVVKAKGRLSNLIEKTDGGKALKGTCGIGHTRWATHGEPSQTNAHPHVSGNCTRSGSGTVESEVVGVHNGIIENYTELKEKLLKHGYTFYSQTDTEVVIKLVDYYYKKYNLGPIDAIAKTMVRVRGSYALELMFRDYPGEIWVARKDSPMIIGIADGETYVASDVPAILKYTRNVYYIGNLEFAKLTPGEAHFYDLNGDEIEKQTTEIKWDAEAAEKGGFEHFMMKEIHEQPKAVQDTLNSVIKNGAIDLSSVEITEDEIKNFEQIYIVACGSAWHVGMAAQYVLEDIADIPVRVKLAKLWERSKDAAVAYHSSYYAEKFRDDADKRLVGVYIDITGNKEIYKRPEMVHLLKDCKNGSVNLIFSQTRAYLAANTCDFCFLLQYLFDMPMRVDVVTDDDDQRIDTILNVDNQRQSLKELAEKYTSIRRKDYLEWRIRLEHEMTKAEKNERGRTV